MHITRELMLYVNTVCPFAMTALMCADISGANVELAFVPLSYELNPRLSLPELDTGNDYKGFAKSIVQSTFKRETGHTTVPVLRVREPFSSTALYVRESEDVCRYFDKNEKSRLLPRGAQFWERTHFFRTNNNLVRSWFNEDTDTSRNFVGNVTAFLADTRYISGDDPGFLDVVFYRHIFVQAAANVSSFDRYAPIGQWIRRFQDHVPSLTSTWSRERASLFLEVRDRIVP